VRGNISPDVIRCATLAYVSRTSWKNPIAVSLTLKEYTGHGIALRRISKIEASQNLRHVMNRVNRKFFGNSYRSPNRFKRRIEVVPVMEFTASGLVHYHLALECPEGVVANELEKELIDAWIGSRWGRTQYHLSPMYNNGWFDYILKVRSKDDYSDCIDWNNLYLPDAV